MLLCWEHLSDGVPCAAKLGLCCMCFVCLCACSLCACSLYARVLVTCTIEIHVRGWLARLVIPESKEAVNVVLKPKRQKDGKKKKDLERTKAEGSERAKRGEAGKTKRPSKGIKNDKKKDKCESTLAIVSDQYVSVCRERSVGGRSVRAWLA